MLPILFQAGSTSFTTNGLGQLSNTIRCEVTEERNGIYELEMEYPITGIHYSEIVEDRILYVKPNDSSSNQAFRIYKVTRPLDGIVTVYAEHISYLLNKIICMPFTASSCTETLARIKENSTTNPFTFTSFKSVTGSFKLEEPKPIRGLLGGEDGSVLSVYGKGEYEFDNFTVNLYVNRGSDNGVSIRYGKNLTELESTTDMSNTYTGIVPYWKKTVESEEVLVTLPEKAVLSGHEGEFAYQLLKVVDLSNEFENQPTEAQLRTRAQKYLSDNTGWNINSNIKISFVALWETEEYKDIAALEHVNLCDKVTVTYPDLGVDVKAEVITTTYDVLNEKYTSIELGDPKTNLAKQISDQVSDAIPDDIPTTDFMQDAINHATKMITGGLGGYVILKPAADGHPEELYILDPDSGGVIANSQNIWRWNSGGLGHSSDYGATYSDVALTMDGHINGKYITAGSVSAYAVRTGYLTDERGYNYWNLDSGEFKLSSTSSKIDNKTVSGYVDGKVDTYDTSLNQQKVFDKLTNNQANQGIYLSNGTLYINASLIGTGTILLGGSASGAPLLVVRNTSNTEIGRWDTSGISVKAGSIKLGSKTQLVDANNGLYLGSDGIGLGNTSANSTKGFKVTNDGTLTASGATISGAITATSLSLGSSASVPWNKVSGTSGVAMKTDIPDVTIYIAKDGTIGSTPADGATGFKVTSTGLLQAANATIWGKLYSSTGTIGGWTLASNQLSSGSGTSYVALSSNTSSSSNYAIWCGNATAGSAPFRVTRAGALYATNATITGTVTANNGQIGPLGVYTNPTTGQAAVSLTKYGGQSVLYMNSDGSIWFYNFNIMTSDGYPIGGWYQDSDLTNNTSAAARGAYTNGHYMRICTGYGIHVLSEYEEYSIFDGGVIFKGSYGPSDRNLKEDIARISDNDSHNFIMGLKPVSFKYKDDKQHLKHHGFIAQDVQEVVQDKWDILTDPSKGPLALSYREIIADLVSVVQQQDKRIKNLETQIA